MVRFRPVYTVLAVVVLLVGCSRTDLLFSVLQSMAKSRVTDHLLLDDEEKVFVEDTIDQGFAEIRRSILPIVAEHMRGWAATVEKGDVSDAFDNTFVTNSRLIVKKTTAIVASYAAKILINHRSPEKLAYLKERLEEGLAERIEETNKPRSELIENWMDRTVTHFERFTGDLTEDQIAIAQRFSDPAVEDQGAWLKNRAERQTALINFLAAQPSEMEIDAFISTLVLRPYELVDPGYQEVSERRWTRLGRLVGSIVRSLNESQRTELAKTLRSYAADFDTVARS